MDPKTTVDKLRILLPHWVEHNQNHAAEYRKWADAARADGATSPAAQLGQAAANMAATDELLKRALKEVGGAAPHAHAGHDHSHDHGHDHAHDHDHGHDHGHGSNA